MKTPNSENDTNSSTADAQNNEIIEMPNVKAPCNVETEIAAMAAEQLEKTPTKATTILSTIIKTTTATTPTTISTTAQPNTDSNDDIEAPPTPAHFITPAPPPTPLASQGGNSSGSSSLQKKKRNNNRNIAKRIELEMTNGANAAAAGGAAVGSGSEGGAVCVGQSSIKTSLSMTSLPPDDEKQDSRDVIKAKLRVERPYNSLKKNADRSMQLSFHSNLISSTPSGGSSNHSNTNNNNKHHRYSWGSSAHSHSSSSLHSSAATLGLGTGKDDLWAAIQTNYNYIMDTNLLDTCKEARYELEGAVSVMENPIDCCFKMLDETQRNEGSCEDPKELRRWLREMESKLEQSPSLSQATLFSIAELQRHLAEHSVLYHEIVSHARVVRACIRAASEREQLQQQQQQQENSTGNSTNNSFAEQNNSSLSSTDEQQQQQQKSNGGEGKSPTSPATTSSSTATNTTSTTTTPTPTATTATAAAAAATTTTKKSEGNLERLQNRYHLLYLKAYEVQLWLDGLLRKKTSTASVLNDDCDDIDDDDSSDCCDDIDGATEDDIDDVPSDLESDDDAAIHNSSSFCDLQRCHTDEDDAKVLSSKGNKLLLLHRDCIENKADCEDGDDEEEDEDEVDCGRLRYSAVVVTAAGNTYHKSGNIGLQQSTATLTDFEADSESSDLETINNAIRRQRKSSDFRYITAQKVPPAAATLAAANTRATETVATLVSHLSATSTVTNNYINNNSTVAPVATTNNNNNNAIAALAISMQQLSLDTQNNTATEAATIANYELPPATDMHTKINGAIVGVAVGELSQQQQQQQQQQHLSPTQRTTLLDIHNNIQVATVPAATTQCNSLSTTCTTATQTQQQQQLQRTPSKAKNVAVISPNCHSNMNGNHHHHHHHVGGGNGGNSNSNKSPTALRKRQQHQRHAVDISKFNRSNRKSKNCAIFYFKHLDTDNETNYGGDGGTISGDGDVVVGGRSGGGSGGLSSSTSHTSDLIKSADPSSDDDEGWLYSATPGLLDTNNSGGVGVGVGVVSSVIISNLVVDGIQSSAVSSSTTAAAAIAAAATTSVISDDSDKENKEAIAAATQAATIANHRNNSFLLSSSSSSLLSSNQISIAEIQLDTRTTTAAKASSKSIAANSNNLISSSSCCSNSSNASCSSSNDLLTEATTTTTTTTSSATATSQITQMHLYRNEMEMQLQINGHNNSENNNCSNQQQQQQQHNKRNNQQSMIAAMKNTPQQQQHFAATADSNGNTEKRSSSGMLYNGKTCYYTRADICNITDKPKEQHLLSPGKRLPPRSPAKSMKSNKSNGTMSTMSPTKEISHESIKQLVLEAEHLVRDEALKTPSKSKHSFLKISSTVKKREVIMPGPIKQRVQEWLAHQPSTPMQLSKSHEPLNSSSTATRNGDDCEASGEASETDSVPQLESESSEGFTDSIATCLQTSTNSYGNSTERMGGSAEPIVSRSAVLGYGSSNQSLNASGGGGGGGCSGLVEILKRQQTRRKSDRPWSVSCLSQLTTESAQVVTKAKAVNNVQAGLATHSISESALDSLSPRRPRTSSSAGTQAHVQQHAKNYDSKGSLKRRKTRKKKHSNSATATATGSAAAYSAGKKTVTDSGSEEISEMPKLTQSLLNNSCETMSAQQIQEVANALQSLQMATAEGGGGAHVSSSILSSEQHQLEGGEEMPNLMKPNFRVGSYTTAYMTNEARLGSLAALATYMNDEEQQGEDTTGTEDHHSSFSETAWDNYQEKYNSENYSEGFDSDAARRLMEFGDDYRNFMDSQSDCCSSLSAANNVDSLSPPRMDSLQQNETKIISQETIVSSVDHARRRRALELEYERRRKTLEIRRKSCQDSSDNQQQQQQQPQPRSPTISLSSSANALTPKNTDANYFQYKHNGDSASRKLEFGMSHSAQSLRRTSESDTSTRRRKADERRRSSRNLEKCIKVIPATTSSSSCDDSDGEKEMRNLLTQSRNRLEDTRSLKIRCHLLRPEDYTEIINTCRDNIRCLEAVLRGPPSTVLSAPCISTSKDLLAAWEDLLGWSENAAAARKMQEEMIVLKHTLIRLGNKSSFELLDTEPSIQITIEALKSEKSQLQTYRKSMLRLNASVHSWLTRQERKLQAAVAEQQLKEAAIKVADVIAAAATAAAVEDINVNTQNTLEQQQHQQQLEQQKAITAEITVTDSNGNQVEAHAIGVSTMKSTSTNTSTDAAEIAEKSAKLETLVQSESEFHKHLKDEVSDMYSAWDEADARINNQLEVLTTSLIAWRQLECGLSEFQQVLGKDRGTLKGLEGALDKGHATPVELAQNVKLVAKLLSEKVNVSQEQLTAVQEHLDPNHILHIAKFTASNGSLSDSGISDGGATSDGGLSERERRLGVLRRLAKQLESALAPGSEAMKSIAARMESAEDELKNLQNTCRDLIVRTAATHQNKKQLEAQRQQQQLEQDAADKLHVAAAATANGNIKLNGHLHNEAGAISKKSQQKAQNLSPSKQHKNKRNERSTPVQQAGEQKTKNANSNATTALIVTDSPGDDDPADDPTLEFELNSSDDDENDGAKPAKGWAWRIAKVALPMQLALFTFLCAACLMQPNCCDNLNNFSMSFTPQLRYIRGPPPI